MTTEQFHKDIESTFDNCFRLLEKKNADYAGVDDPFRNFKASALIGVTPQRAILVRLQDKITRISNLLNRDNVVLDEKIEDTIEDAINYLAILKASLNDESL